jgi:uncharacterized protein (TIGR02001 family)
MKKLTHIVTGIVFASSGLFVSTASAEVSYNIGWASEYYYRGILQKNSSGSAGIDYTEGGFYAGGWAADVGDGLEVDGFFGYNYETDSGFTLGAGFTGYYYTGEFDDTYEEVNFNFGYGMVAVEYSVGEWEGFGASKDYDFLAVTLAGDNGFYGTFGTFGDELDGEYVELGWGTTISDIDFGVAAIFNSDEISDQKSSSGAATEGEAFVFTIGKSF